MNPSEFDEIIFELVRRPLVLSRTRVNAGVGRTQTFGIVRKRTTPPDYSRHCRDRPKLYQLLLKFGQEHVDIPWNAVTVNQNYQCLPHKDTNNVNDSWVVAFGDFSGGQLVVEGLLFDIKHKPVFGDFSRYLHSVMPFTGNRYSLVFHTCPGAADDIPPPSVRIVNGFYKFFRGEEMIEKKKCNVGEKRKKTG